MTTTPRRPANRGRQPAQLPRRHLLTRPLVLLTMFVGLGLLAVLVVETGSDDTSTNTPDIALNELEAGKALWEPDYDRLQQRVEALGFPPLGDESYHVHSLLSVYVDGDRIEVPTNIGIDETARFASPLHTHQPFGVIHLEAGSPYPFTLGDVFKVWGVAFDSGRLGEYRDAGDRTVQVYVNGARVRDFVKQPLADGDNVVVAYGKPGTFPKQPPTDALTAEVPGGNQ